MSHIAVLCPPATGHMNPTMALCRELQRRGHRITFYQPEDGKEVVEKNGFQCHVYAQEEFPKGSLAKVYAQLGKMQGLSALRYTVELICQRSELCLQHLPSLMRQDQIDLLISDEIALEGSTLAEKVGVPFVTLSNALVLKQEKAIPPFFKTWGYSASRLSQVRNQAAYTCFNLLMRGMNKTVNGYRRRNKMQPYAHRQDALSSYAHLSQQVAEFDFPRRQLPPSFHYVGPFHDDTSPVTMPFDFGRLNGKPLVYASMGTLQNRQKEIFRAIAEACADFPVQLVLSLGGGGKPERYAGLPGEPVIVPYAPQVEILKRAHLCITHAGLNTALECLTQGVPMAAIPVTNDQPGVAARIEWCGAGLLTPLAKLSAARLRTVLRRLLDEPSFRERAGRMKEIIAKSGRASRAADIIEGIRAAT